MVQVQLHTQLISPRSVRVEWSDGRCSDFSALWLRLHCQEDRDPFSGQRLVDLTDLPQSPRVRSVDSDEHDLIVDWETEDRRSRFPLAWLHANRAEAPPPEPLPDQPWRGLSKSHFCWLDYATFAGSRDARILWLTALTGRGVAFLSDVPCEPGQVLEIAGRIGSIYETNYGRFFDVKAVPQPENLSNTNGALALHSDNPYRDPVPGYQILHCLQEADEGGESMFADGFALANVLRAQDPEAFEILSTTRVEFAYRSKNADLRAERPLIQVSPSGRVEAVRYNNRSLGTIHLAADRLEQFVSAYRKFGRILQDPAHRLRVRLKPGDLVAFDNHRLLHGRTAFTAGSGGRHLQGCYLTRDSIRSNFLIMQRSQRK